MSDDLGKKVLKGVSRSFYITLRLLPAPMRGAASLGYLLARTSDTIADTMNAPLGMRVQGLDQFKQALLVHSDPPRWPLPILNALSDPRERHLLECSSEIFQWLGNLPGGEADLVREVVDVIISGQKLDLERFANASREHPISLADDAALEDYAWRVAGCVGEFWTKLGFLTLGNRFSTSSEAKLLAQGRAYGMGLQLVNILRDLPEDLATGRCYLPVADPVNREVLLARHREWTARASEWVAEGKNYSASLISRRLRAATVLPALLAEKTLEPLASASWEMLQTRIRIPRTVVYQSLLKAFF
ncbi:MAG: squalene/phytoene synthase family protein [Luteolibacter sp.]